MSEANKNDANGQMSMPMQQQQQQAAIMIDSMKKKHKHVSNTSTPNPYIEKREDGFEYVDEGYMRALLNEFFPVWNWEIKKYEIRRSLETMENADHIIDLGPEAGTNGGQISSQGTYDEIKKENTVSFCIRQNRFIEGRGQNTLQNKEKSWLKK